MEEKEKKGEKKDTEEGLKRKRSERGLQDTKNRLLSRENHLPPFLLPPSRDWKTKNVFLGGYASDFCFFFESFHEGEYKWDKGGGWS